MKKDKKSAVKSVKTKGMLVTEMIKAMAEKGIKQIDFPSLTKNRVQQSTIAAIFRGTISRNTEILDHIARALKKSPKDFRLYAALDNINRELQHYGFTWDDLYQYLKIEQKQKYQLPVFEMEKVSESFSTKGYPVREPAFLLETPFEHGPDSYGVFLKDSILSPRVNPGEIAIFARDYESGVGEEYGIVGSKKGTFIGKIIEHPNYVIVETLRPYNVNHIEKKEVHYLHRIVGTFRPKK